MAGIRRLAEELTIMDIRQYPVWEYLDNDCIAPDTTVQPVEELPVDHLNGRLVGTRVQLKNLSFHWAILSNISLNHPRATRQFLCLTIEKEGQWFELARYHDVDFDKRSPLKMADFLGVPLTDIFPIDYDISRIAVGDPEVIKGTIPAIPEEKLTREQLMSLAIESTV